MKKLTLLVTLIVTLFGFCTPASAQAQGRPDPTGQGRYQQFGPVVTYPGAHVVRQLPDGAECAPAGEMVGARVWNSTREGFAVMSELSDKAQIATTTQGATFLCGCAKGFNQIFLEKTPVASAQRLGTVEARDGKDGEPGPAGPPGPQGPPGHAPVVVAAQQAAPQYYEETPTRPCGLIGGVIWLLFGTCEGPVVAIAPSYGGGYGNYGGYQTYSYYQGSNYQSGGRHHRTGSGSGYHRTGGGNQQQHQAVTVINTVNSQPTASRGGRQSQSPPGRGPGGRIGGYR